ncbi:MAG TPA: hypothetical protein VF779_19205 [Pyrinomonadaceae bacterium]
MKRIIASACLILTFVFGLPSFAQAQRRNASRSQSGKRKTANHPPTINSFEPEFSKVVIPCPPSAGLTSCEAEGKWKLKLSTTASDLDGDKLLYKYSVTAGRIIGEGPEVTWDIIGNDPAFKPGAFIAKVSVEDRKGGVASETATVIVDLCQCHFPCSVIDMSCPETVEEGDIITLRVTLSGQGIYKEPTYNWSITAGTVVRGQGTSKIEVDTTGAGDKKLKATVLIDGLNPECDREGSCEVLINKKSEQQRQ